MLEPHHKPLAPAAVYNRRVAIYGSVALLGMLAVLGVGVLGYHTFAGLPWLDALVNASMILGGMGPVDPVLTTWGKWFVSVYAIFSGVAFLTSVGIMLAPIAHRTLHRFHLEMGDEPEPPGKGRKG